MVIQKEKGGRGGGREEGCARASASPLGRVHSGPTLTFPGPGAEERDREREREKLENAKAAGHETGEH